MAVSSPVAVVRQQIRFALAGLGARNANHEFEHLCRDFARARISPSLLPSTGPVSAGGEHGRDFETFTTFAADDGQRKMVFANTLTQSARLPQKNRSDLGKIMSGGP